MSSGRLTVGDAQGGFRGWIDDFKVIARKPNSEVICNHARGTLVSDLANLSPSRPGLVSLAAAYPATSHSAVTQAVQMGPSYAEYACERPIADRRAHDPGIVALRP